MAFVQIQCFPTFQSGEANTEAETSRRVLNTDHIVSARAYDDSTTHVTLVGNVSFIVAASLDDFHNLLTTANPA